MWKVLQGNSFAIFNKTEIAAPRIIHFERKEDARFICDLLNKQIRESETCARCSRSVVFLPDSLG